MTNERLNGLASLSVYNDTSYRPVRRISKRGFLIVALDDPRRGGLGAQPPDADESLICHCL